MMKESEGNDGREMSMPPVRIVIPCREADGVVERCIAAATGQSAELAEVIVVDDGGNTVLNTLQAKYPFEIRITDGGIGAGAARNAGAQGFRGTALVFVDADVEVAGSDTLMSLVSPILNHNAEATVGRYAHASAGSLSATYKQLYLAYTYGKKSGDLHNTFWSALCAVDREWFGRLGGFPECYRGAGPEDIEFGIVLSRRGGRIEAIPAAEGIHHRQMTFMMLVVNDFRKGCEDVYVHLTRRVPLTENRHVEPLDIVAVALAGGLLLGGFCLPVIGAVPLLGLMPCYVLSRYRLLRGAFTGFGSWFLLKASVITFVLDLVRGAAVSGGMLLWLVEIMSKGRMKPFRREPSGYRAD
jgi:cellulose synthase/poly-beta-1,6-N-acetylglucosamine synthase-like glycosyltransferase